MKTIKQMMIENKIQPMWNHSIIGIEREGLRVKRDGSLATTVHPPVLGNRSFHPYIQTDFSEVQLELITPPLHDNRSIYRWLSVLHNVTVHSMSPEEQIWPLSMPASLPDEENIPIARLDKQADVEYREYLAKVYGKNNQMQSGVHINFEFSPQWIEALFEQQTETEDRIAFKSDLYMKLARNFLRHRWLLTYLFGASPTVYEGFYNADEQVPDHYVRSLRNSHLGYVNNDKVIVPYHSVESYVKGIEQLVESGDLSEEREFYSSIRMRGTKNVGDMLKKGISYVEFRSFDLNPFHSFGVTKETLDFVRLFGALMIWIDEGDKKATSKTGEEKNLLTALEYPTAESQFKMEGKSLLTEMREMVGYLSHPEKALAIIDWAEDLLEHPEKTVAAKIVKGIEENGDMTNFGLRLAEKYKQENTEKPYQLRGLEHIEMSTQMLIHDAIQMGLKVKMIDEHDQFVRLKHGDHIEYVKNGNMTSKDTYISSLIMANKTVTKKILADHGFDVPRSGEYQSIETAKKNYERYQNQGIVVKPKSTNYGIGISIFKQGASQESFDKALEIAFKEDDSVLVEEFIHGTEYRFFVIDKEVPAVLLRIPANVVGNGHSTVKELVAVKNQDPLRGTNHLAPLEQIQLGEIEQLMLQQQGYTIDSVPEADETVYLRENSNISTGGDSIDVTDEMDDSYKVLAVQMAKAIEAKVTGIDLIIPDLTKPSSLSDPGYSVIEANFNPAMHMHAFVYKGKNRRLTIPILELLFPELKK